MGMLVPVTGTIQLAMYVTHADRYTYLPGIGFAIAVTWAVADWSIGWKHRRLALGSMMAATIGSLAVCAHTQTSYWKDSQTLWARALSVTSDNFIALNNMGTLLTRQGRVDDAIADLRKCIAIAPRNAEACNNLGNALANKGEDDDAMAQYEKALALSNNKTTADYNLANLLLKHNRLDEAIAHYRRAIQEDPAMEAAHNNLASALLLKGDTAGAMACLEKAVALNPDPLARSFSLGNEFMKESNWQAAIVLYQQAIKINPRYGDAWDGLGMARFRSGHPREALDALQKAIDINPNDFHAMNNLAELLIMAADPSLRNSSNAVATATKASQLSGRNNPMVSVYAGGGSCGGRKLRSCCNHGAARRGVGLGAKAGHSGRRIAKGNQILRDKHPPADPYPMTSPLLPSPVKNR